MRQKASRFDPGSWPICEERIDDNVRLGATLVSMPEDAANAEEKDVGVMAEDEIGGEAEEMLALSLLRSSSSFFTLSSAVGGLSTSFSIMGLGCWKC